MQILATIILDVSELSANNGVSSNSKSQEADEQPHGAITSNNIGVSLGQLLAFTNGLLSRDVVEMSFKLADKDRNGLLNDYGMCQISFVSNCKKTTQLEYILFFNENDNNNWVETDRFLRFEAENKRSIVYR